MNRICACIASLIALAMPTLATAEPPYLKGRLTHTAYIEIAGKPSEIADIRTYAASRGWKVVCEQSVGDQATLRLRFPVGTAQSAIEGYFAGDLRHPRDAKDNMIYYGMKTSSPLCIRLP